LATPVLLGPGTYWIEFSGESTNWGFPFDDVFFGFEGAVFDGLTWIPFSSAFGLPVGLSFSITGIETIEVDIDLKPQSCPNPVNVFSKGLVPVAILGTAEFDVNDIVISSLPDRTVMHTIEDVAAPFGGPIIDQFSCTEAGPDGFDDLIFKIPSSELNCLPDGVLALLIIDGVLLDGTPFEGSDVAKVINKKACPVT
jgi:hypothetical protein